MNRGLLFVRFVAAILFSSAPLAVGRASKLPVDFSAPKSPAPSASGAGKGLASGSVKQRSSTCYTRNSLHHLNTSDMNRGVRFVAAILFSLAVLEVGLASLSISRAGCGESKHCVESPVSCEPNGSSPCLFASAAADQSELSVSLRGDSAGYIALGLTNTSQHQGESTLLACAQNGSHVFFRTVERNNSDPDAPPSDRHMPVMNFTGELENGSSISCMFSVPLSNITDGHDTVFTLLLGSGAVAKDSSLGAFNVSRRLGPVDLMKFTKEPPTTTAPPMTEAPAELSISRAGCGESKLCVESPAKCEPNHTSPCLFFSAAVNQSELSLSLRGDSAGYVALGLVNGSEDLSSFFVCGKRKDAFFFLTAQRNNSVQNGALTKSNMSVEGMRGELSGNVTKCVFKLSTPDLHSRSGSDLVFQVILGTGAVNGTGLGSLVEHLKTSLLDLSNPKVPTVPGRAVCPMALLYALILPLLLTVSLTN